MNGPVGIPTVAVIDHFMGMLAVLERCGCEGQLECCAEHRHQWCGVTGTHQCFCLERHQVRSTPSLACLYGVHSLFFLGLKKIYSVFLSSALAQGRTRLGEGQLWVYFAETRAGDAQTVIPGNTG